MKKMKKFLMSAILMFAFIAMPNLNAAVEDTAALETLTITGIKGSFTFDKTKEAQAGITVAHDATSVELTATLNTTSTGATITYNGKTSSTVDLAANTNEITIVVENSTDKKSTTYTIAVTREAAPKEKAKLSALTVSAGTINFNANVLEYEFEVENNITELTVTATGANGATATVEGATDGKVTLKEGLNTINIKVQKDVDTDTLNTYVLKVTRKAAVSSPVIEELEEKLKKEFNGTISVAYSNENLVELVNIETLQDGSKLHKYFTIERANGDTADILLSKIATQKDKIDYVVIELPESGIVGEETLNFIKDSNEEYLFWSANGYVEWTIDGSKITDKDVPFSINVTLGEDVVKATREAIEKLLVNKEKSLVIDFEHTGSLPKGTKVSISVEDKFKEGDTLTLYYYNTKTNKLEVVNKNIKVNEYGYVEFALEHCSSYVLTTATNNAATGAMDVTLYVLLAVSSLAGMAYVAKRKAN